MKKNSGFSLVELMVVIGLVSLLSVAISSMVLTTIAQITRVRNQIRVRQSGDYALGQIQTMLRNSRTIISCDSVANSITIINPDGGTTLFLSEDLGDHVAIASNSGQYLTASDTTVGDTFDLECLPTDDNVNLVKISFTLNRAILSDKAKENANIRYETSIELRNN